MDLRSIPDDALRVTPAAAQARAYGIPLRAWNRERARRGIAGRRGHKADLARRIAILSRLARGETTTQVARALGITPQRVRQVRAA